MTYSQYHTSRKTVLMTCFLALLLFSSGCRVWYRTKVSSSATIASRQYVQRAAESIEQQNVENASAQLKLAVKSNPQNFEARTMLADTLWNQNLREEAIRQMEKVVVHPEVTPELVVKLAWMYFEVGNYSLAQKYVTLSLKFNASIADAWFLQGRIYAIQNQMEPALMAYHQAAFYDTDNVKIQKEIAELYLKLNKPQRALEAAQVALRQSSAETPSPEMTLCEGRALLQLDRTHDAVRVLAQASQLNPENTEILTALADAHYRSGNLNEAYRTANLGIALDPNNADCIRILRDVSSPITVTPNAQIGTAVRLPAPDSKKP